MFVVILWQNTLMDKIIIFTLTLQPSCRVAGQSLSESQPDFGFIYSFVDIRQSKNMNFLHFDSKTQFTRRIVIYELYFVKHG